MKNLKKKLQHYLVGHGVRYIGAMAVGAGQQNFVPKRNTGFCWGPCRADQAKLLRYRIPERDLGISTCGQPGARFP